MQVNSTSYAFTAIQALKTGNSLPPNKARDSQSAPEKPSIRELAKSIDPSNMTRNDARAIASVLGQAGDIEIDNAIALQSMIPVNENGNLRAATESDAIMNEKFNMFDALKSSIEFHKSKGLPTSHLEDGLNFLEKFRTFGENPEINVYT